MFWRFFVGLGIGAEYPLSAVITAEYVFFVSLHSRGYDADSYVLDLPPDDLEHE